MTNEKNGVGNGPGGKGFDEKDAASAAEGHQSQPLPAEQCTPDVDEQAPSKGNSALGASNAERYSYRDELPSRRN